MASYLDAIVAAHREAASLDERSVDTLMHLAKAGSALRDFGQRLREKSVGEIAVIAELKRRSPSRGDLDSELVPSQIAAEYAAGGAACISVLTDEGFFGGSAHDLQEVRDAVDLPVLRKDFTVDVRDICDARLMGADAVLLIVAALDDVELADFHAASIELGMTPLVEIHDEVELERALAIGASLVGVNQRDLITFKVDEARAVRLVTMIPDNVVKVAESGIWDGATAALLRDVGYDALLVGESLVTSQDRCAAVRTLRCSPKPEASRCS